MDGENGVDAGPGQTGQAGLTGDKGDMGFTGAQGIIGVNVSVCMYDLFVTTHTLNAPTP